MPIIPFYGVDLPDLFAIERAAMDRPGRVIHRLDRLLPSGTIADIGAGDGFTAQKLQRPQRRIVAVEPARGMIDPGRHDEKHETEHEGETYIYTMTTDERREFLNNFHGREHDK